MDESAGLGQGSLPGPIYQQRRSPSVRERAANVGRWVLLVAIVLFGALLLWGYIDTHRASIEHSFGIGSTAWEEGYTYGQKAVGSSSLNTLDLEVTEDCRGTYNVGWNLWIQAGAPGLTKHTNTRQWIPQFRQGCIQGATDQWNADNSQ